MVVAVADGAGHGEALVPALVKDGDARGADTVLGLDHETPLPRPLRDGWAALISTDKTQTGVIRFLIGPWRGTALSVCKVALWYSGSRSVDQKEEHRTEATDRRVFLEHRLLTRTPRT